MKDKEVAEDKMSNTEKRLEEDIENQKTNYHDASSIPKRTGYGKFAEGQMIGGIYKLEQGSTTFITMFD